MMFDFFKTILNHDNKPERALERINSGWKMEILAGEDAGKILSLDYSYIILGRKDKKKNDHRRNAIRFDDQSISYEQAHFEWNAEERKYALFHDRIPVVNPTYVNYKKMKVGQKIIIDDNSVIRMGNLVFALQEEQLIDGVSNSEAVSQLNVNSTAKMDDPSLKAGKPETLYLPEDEKEQLSEAKPETLALDESESPNKGKLPTLELNESFENIVKKQHLPTLPLDENDKYT